jgi:hypothetical protein
MSRHSGPCKKSARLVQEEPSLGEIGSSHGSMRHPDAKRPDSLTARRSADTGHFASQDGTGAIPFKMGATGFEPVTFRV